MFNVSGQFKDAIFPSPAERKVAEIAAIPDLKHKGINAIPKR